MYHFKRLTLHGLISIVAMFVFFTFMYIFTNNYLSDLDLKLGKTNTNNINTVCAVSNCVKIYDGASSYTKADYETLSPIPKTDILPIPLVEFNNGYISKEYNLIMKFQNDINSPIYHIEIDTHLFDEAFITLVILLMLSANISLLIIDYFSYSNKRAMDRISFKRDKANLKFDNLMFFIENLNHEVNNPLFIMSKKMKEIKKINDENGMYLTEKQFKPIDESLNQISKLMTATRSVKNINKPSEDMPISRLVGITMDDILIMRAEHFDYDTSPELDTYCLDQDKLDNAVFVNLLTKLVKNSIETFSDEFKVLFHSYKKGQVYIKLVDNGNGIPKGEESKIFSRKYIGKENNIFTLKEIVDNTNGQIKLVSSKVSETVFCFTVPAKKI